MGAKFTSFPSTIPSRASLVTSSKPTLNPTSANHIVLSRKETSTCVAVVCVRSSFMGREEEEKRMEEVGYDDIGGVLEDNWCKSENS